MDPPQNPSEFQLKGKTKKNNYHNLDKQNLASERPNKNILISMENIPGQVSHYVHIKYPTQQILKKFGEYAKRKGYRSIKTFENQLLLVDSRLIAKAKRFFSCIVSGFRQKLIRFWVTTDEYKSLRVLQISSLNKQANDDPILRGMLVEFSQIQLPDPAPREDIDDEPQDLYSLEATSKYMYSKMLLVEGYAMGQKTRQFLNKVGKHTLHKPVEKSLVIWVQQMKNEMVQDLLKGFNISRKQLTQIIPFCRITTQQFLYTRIFIDEGEINVPSIQTYFKNTCKQIQKLNYIVTPCQLQRQFFWISVAYDHEFSSSNEKRQTLQELIKEVKPRNIQSKVDLVKIYQQVLGESYAWKSIQPIISTLI